jgi:biopolymer transport protein ExbB
MTLLQFFTQSDAITAAVALLLLAMSVASWVVIVWKAWLLWQAHQNVPRATAAFWQAASLELAPQAVKHFDPQSLVLPMVDAIDLKAITVDSVANSATPQLQLTRLLRDALHSTMARLQYGQVVLATVGSTAPFVGLLGTVWGIYHALISISGAGQLTIDKVAGPVGEALIMTAAGLAVAIPAVLAYNVLGRSIARIEADLEGFAHDLRELHQSCDSQVSQHLAG